MRRTLGMLTLLATGGLVVALWLPEPLPQHAGGARLGFGSFSVEPASFVAGLLVAAVIVRLCRLPWGRLIEAVGVLLRIWRRNAALLAMAAVFAGILLFY